MSVCFALADGWRRDSLSSELRTAGLGTRAYCSKGAQNRIAEGVTKLFQDWQVKTPKAESET